MEYTVQKLARMAGISARTLRYYDEIGILKPARINSSGYRIYGAAEVDRLQQVLFYRELGLPLEQIGEIVTSPSFDGLDALKSHRAQLLEKSRRLELLIANVEKTIAMHERRISMSDQEKFEGFKQRMIADNERKYGKEVRDKYGEEAVNRSNEKVANMTQEEYAEATRLEEEFQAVLAEAFAQGDPAGPLAQRAVDLHRQWLSHFWGEYSRKAHANLAQMYVDDERFREHYDEKRPGTAVFLRDAVRIYADRKS